MKKSAHYPNRDDWKENFWKHNYKILVTMQGIEFRVNADCEQDAIDYIIDDCKENHKGLVSTYEEMLEFCDEEFIDEYISGGNEGLYLNTHNVHIEILNK